VTTVRLLSYNIRALRDDASAVSRVIRAAAPDVVCIQEAPRFLRWRSRCAALARHSGLVVVNGGRPAGSNLVLSTLAVTVESSADVLLTKDPRLHQRGTAIACLRLGSARFAVAGIHLDLREGPRLRHVRELHDAIDAHVDADVPSVVAGDVNDLPGSPVWTALARRGVDAHVAAGSGDGFTYSAINPVRRIDGVFVDARMAVRSITVVDGDDVRLASDHRPLLVELDVP
jgi:endonuclease/exonuclease/phosphatase family metal-dependent hydrolase